MSDDLATLFESGPGSASNPGVSKSLSTGPTESELQELLRAQPAAAASSPTLAPKPQDTSELDDHETLSPDYEVPSPFDLGTPEIEDEGDGEATMVEPPPPPVSAADEHTAIQGGLAPPFAPGTAPSRESMAASHRRGAQDGRQTEGWASAADPAAAGERYTIQEEIARGGIGRIIRARDPRLLRDVAFKELLPEAQQYPESSDRFIREAQVTGQLEHPGIVPVYDLGFHPDGRPYYCMRLLSGKTMRDAIVACHKLPPESADRHLAFVKLLREFIAVCQAIAFAHERGVLHRDLKPLNIMLGDFGETIVLDWGMAKVMGVLEEIPAPAPVPLEDSGPEECTMVQSAAPSSLELSAHAPSQGASTASASVTQSVSGSRMSQSRRSINIDTDGTQTQQGSLMGTLPYMPPEQVLGLIDQMDARTDVYALGAILYEILTTVPPIKRGSMQQRMWQITQGQIDPPRTKDSSIARPLEAICLKALAKEKDSRYASALLMAEDVERFLADERVSAYKEPWHIEARRWIRRNKTLVTCACAIALVSGLGWLTALALRHRHLQTVAVEAMGQFELANGAMERGEYKEAARALRQASGALIAEPALKGTDLERRLHDLEHLRIAGVERKADQLLAKAEAAEKAERLVDARQWLGETLALLGDEPDLTQRRKSVQARETKVQEALVAHEMHDDERDRFAKFHDEMDQARFFGSLFRGESVVQDSAEARVHALRALQQYGLEIGTPPKPEAVAPAEWTLVLQDALEALLIVAEAEVMDPANRGTGKDADQKGAVNALGWIDRARRLDISCRVLEQRAATYYGMIGDKQRQAAAIATAETIPARTALDFFLSGEVDRKAGRYPQAISAYESALRADPDHYWSMQFLGLCYLQQQHPAAAAASYTACLARRPDFAWTWCSRAVAYAELEQFDQSLADFAEAESRDPKLMAVYLNRGAVQVIRGAFDAARADFEKAAELRPDRADPLINLAEAYRQQADLLRVEQPDEATPLFQQALMHLDTAAGLAATHPQVYALRGDVKLRLGKPHEAIADLEQSIRFDPQPARIAASYRLLALAYRQTSRLPDALKCLEAAVKHAPRNAELHHELAELQLQSSQHEAAVKSLSRSLELKGGPPAAQPSAPTVVSEEAAKLAAVYKTRGLTAAQLGQYRQAMQDYTRSLELQSAAPTLTRRGWGYLLQATQLAADDFDEAIHLNPADPDAWNGRGYARVLLGDVRGAVHDAEKAVEKAQLQLATEGPRTWPLIYNAATIYAQAAFRTPPQVELQADTASVRPNARRAYEVRAVELLRQAFDIAGGPARELFLRTVESDTALDPLRAQPEFQDFLTNLRQPSTPKR